MDDETLKALIDDCIDAMTELGRAQSLLEKAQSKIEAISLVLYKEWDRK